MNRRRRVLVLAAGALLVAASPDAHVQAQAQRHAQPAATQAVTWSLADDVRAHPDLNPFPDGQGHDATWALQYADTGADLSTYTLLPEHTENICVTSAAQGWRANGYLPVIGVNTGDADLSCGTSTAPAHRVLAHPSPAQDAIIAWTAPVSGTFTVSGGVGDDDPNGGNGVGYRLARGSLTLDEGVIDDGGSADFAAGGVPVAAGERIYVVITARGGNSDYDLTAVDLTISGATAPPTATVRRATPGSVPRGTTGTVTLTGTGFGAQTQVALDDSTGIEVGVPTVVSSKKLRVPVAVTDDAPPITRHWQVFEDGTSRVSCADPSLCSLTVVDALRLDAIDPATVARGQSIELSLSGSGFTPGMTLKVSGPGISVGPVTVDTPTSAQVHLDTSPTARAIRRSVTLTNPDGKKSTLKRALAVAR